MRVTVPIPLPTPNSNGCLSEAKLAQPWSTEVEGDNKRFTFDYGKMYEAPDLGYRELRALAEHFGTEKVNTLAFSESGCETCDHGSSYGHTLIIEGATKNLPFPLPA